MRQMMSMKKLALLLAVLAATCLGAATGHAQNTRSWVSGVGSDGNPCSRTSPCLTFAHALTQTNSGGEINCLDPGGFGAVTINIPVTINCEGASNGGITASGGQAAITISASGAVNLIGLDINGEGTNGTGVSITAGANVNIRNCKIYNFTNGNGIGLNGNGATLVVDNTFIANNDGGIQQYVISGISNMSVRNSNISNNNYGILVQVPASTHAGATIEQTTLAFNNQYGLWVTNTGAVAVIGSSTVVNNNGGVAASGGGTIYSFKNNQIGGNSNDGTPLTAYPGFSGGGA
jgi:hypothetical protein